MENAVLILCVLLLFGVGLFAVNLISPSKSCCKSKKRRSKKR